MCSGNKKLSDTINISNKTHTITTMTDQVNQRLLKLHSSGLYNALTPEQALSLFHETKAYLNTAFQNVLLDSSKELYDLAELQFYLALITHHDTEAKLMLDRLTDKFGHYTKSQRIAILRSVYLEATTLPQPLGNDKKDNGSNNNDSTNGYQEAAKFLETLPQFGKRIDVIRRRTYLTSKLTPGSGSGSAGANAAAAAANEYVKDLLSYLDVKPSDNQAWYELSEVYLKLGNYQQSIYSLQQILLNVPFAYNVHYKLATVYQSYAFKTLFDFSSTNNNTKKDSFNYNSATIERFYTYYTLAIKHFLKSVELSESYYKSWAGVFVLTKPLKFKNKNLLTKFEENGKTEEYKKLNKLAENKLKEIVEKNWVNEENKQLIEKVLATE